MSWTTAGPATTGRKPQIRPKSYSAVSRTLVYPVVCAYCGGPVTQQNIDDMKAFAEERTNLKYHDG